MIQNLHLPPRCQGGLGGVWGPGLETLFPGPGAHSPLQQLSPGSALCPAPLPLRVLAGDSPQRGRWASPAPQLCFHSTRQDKGQEMSGTRHSLPRDARGKGRDGLLPAHALLDRLRDPGHVPRQQEPGPRDGRREAALEGGPGPWALPGPPKELVGEDRAWSPVSRPAGRGGARSGVSTGGRGLVRGRGGTRA